MKKRVFNLDDFIQVAQEKFGTKFDAYLIEQSILSKYVDARIYTKWSTELFKYDVLSGSINNEV